MTSKTKQPIKYMSAREFHETGYLFELNRCFLHPLGLALEVKTDPHDPKFESSISGIWDYRDDEEGMRFGELGADDQKKADVIEKLRSDRVAARVSKLGYWIQPCKVEEKAASDVPSSGHAIEMPKVDPPRASDRAVILEKRLSLLPLEERLRALDLEIYVSSEEAVPLELVHTGEALVTVTAKYMNAITTVIWLTRTCTRYSSGLDSTTRKLIFRLRKP
ncbi:hypothetical protein LCGC14_3060290, partial [marine sediment metagenome]